MATQPHERERRPEDYLSLEFQDSIRIAQEEARRFEQDFIATEHLFLAIVDNQQCHGHQTLRQLDVDMNRIRGVVELFIQTGKSDQPDVVHKPFDLTPKAKIAVAFSVDEAKGHNRQKVNTNDLLLALVKQDENIASALHTVGVDFYTVHKATESHAQISPVRSSETTDPLMAILKRIANDKSMSLQAKYRFVMELRLAVPHETLEDLFKQNLTPYQRRRLEEIAILAEVEGF